MFSPQVAAYPVARIGFGYVNSFSFPADDFDLSDHFRIHLGVQTPSSAGGLSGLELRLRFEDEDLASTHITTVVAVDPSAESDSPTISLRTTIGAETRDLKGICFGSQGAVSEQIKLAKEVAKRGFFELATDSLRARMGAEYDES